MLTGAFNELSPAAAVTLCSCLITADMEKVKRTQPAPPELLKPFAELQVGSQSRRRAHAPCYCGCCTHAAPPLEV
eukprot:2871174-Prymnesium_polylepis.2